MSTSMAPKKLMFSEWAGEMWARTSSSIRRPAAHLLDGQAVVLGRPRDHGVGHEREAPWGLTPDLGHAESSTAGEAR